MERKTKIEFSSFKERTKERGKNRNEMKYITTYPLHFEVPTLGRVEFITSIPPTGELFTIFLLGSVTIVIVHVELFFSRSQRNLLTGDL